MGEKIRLVIAKNENSAKKCLFKIFGNESLRAGDLILVENKSGKELATCLCDDFGVCKDSDKYRTILAAFDVSEPLANVLGEFHYYGFKQEGESDNEF